MIQRLSTWSIWFENRSSSNWIEWEQSFSSLSYSSDFFFLLCYVALSFYLRIGESSYSFDSSISVVPLLFKDYFITMQSPWGYNSLCSIDCSPKEWENLFLYCRANALKDVFVDVDEGFIFWVSILHGLKIVVEKLMELLSWAYWSLWLRLID